MQNRGFTRMQVDVLTPLRPGFWWTNSRGEDKWASIRYERLSDLCYDCGILGHTSPTCQAEIVVSEVNCKLPMYGPWINGVRPRKLSGGQGLGGGKAKPQMVQRDPARKSWRDMLSEAELESSKEDKRRAPEHNREDTPAEVVNARGMLFSPAKEAHPGPDIRRSTSTPKQKSIADKANKPDTTLSLSHACTNGPILDLNLEPTSISPSQAIRPTRPLIQPGEALTESLGCIPRACDLDQPFLNLQLPKLKPDHPPNKPTKPIQNLQLTQMHPHHPANKPVTGGCGSSKEALKGKGQLKQHHTLSVVSYLEHQVGHTVEKRISFSTDHQVGHQLKKRKTSSFKPEGRDRMWKEN